MCTVQIDAPESVTRLVQEGAATAPANCAHSRLRAHVPHQCPRKARHILRAPRCSLWRAGKLAKPSRPSIRRSSDENAY